MLPAPITPSTTSDPAPHRETPPPIPGLSGLGRKNAIVRDILAGFEKAGKAKRPEAEVDGTSYGCVVCSETPARVVNLRGKREVLCLRCHPDPR